MRSVSILFLTIISNKLDSDAVVYNFSGTNLGKVQSHFYKIRFENINPKLRDIKFSFLRALNACDIIFDVTMGDSFSDIYSKDYYDSLIRDKLIAEKLCNKYILLPQTYGPFEHKSSADKAKRSLIKHIKYTAAMRCLKNY